MQKYHCARGTPDISLGLKDAAWTGIPWTQDFVDILGQEGPVPRFGTRVKMLWDPEFFYVLSQMEEPQAWATITEHNAVIFQDNDFEVFIDPDGDAARYFEFEVNAFGTTWDLFLERPYREGGSADSTWESGAGVAVFVDGCLNDPTIGSTEWVVALAFPWKAFAEWGGMAFPPKIGDAWRVNFSRVQWQVDVVDGRYVKRVGIPEDNWVWSPQGVIDMHQPERWGTVTFCDERG